MRKQAYIIDIVSPIIKPKDLYFLKKEFDFFIKGITNNKREEKTEAQPIVVDNIPISKEAPTPSVKNKTTTIAQTMTIKTSNIITAIF